MCQRYPTTPPHHSEVITTYDYNLDDLDYLDDQLVEKQVNKKFPININTDAHPMISNLDANEPNYPAIIGMAVFISAVLITAIALFVLQWRNRIFHVNDPVRMNNIKE